MQSTHSLTTLALLTCAAQLHPEIPAPVWQSPARLHRNLKKSIPGTLTIDASGVEFRSPPYSQRWPYLEIQTFDLPTSHELILTGYENRGVHLPGERRYHFELREPMPEPVATQLAASVSKPSINGIPEAKAAFDTELPARHHAAWGGSNGVLRFRESGVDYVTGTGHDNRSWRWSDIQTIANPDPYRFRITGFRETFDFELKQPLSRELFDRLWDRVYARDLNISPKPEGVRL